MNLKSALVAAIAGWSGRVLSTACATCGLLYSRSTQHFGHDQRKNAGFPSDFRFQTCHPQGSLGHLKITMRTGDMCMMCYQSAKNLHVPRPKFPLSQASNMQQQQDYFCKYQQHSTRARARKHRYVCSRNSKARVFSLSNHSSPGTRRACFSQKGIHQPLRWYLAKIC